MGGGYAGKRGHIPQLSISDENHHVTEAIGDMYGDHHYGTRDLRPLSFVTLTGPGGSQNSTVASRAEPPLSVKSRNPLARTTSGERIHPQVNGKPAAMASEPNTNRDNSALLPGHSVRQRSNSDTATSQFPLNDLDYESDPAAVAQELSNLQALRRMSMDVNAAGDPDLPSFGSNMGVPSAAPTGAADEDDRARLFWVPARIHPELAPTEFKTFLDSRVNSIKRRSEDRSLSPDDLQREGSGGGLRRKKSMLSRQIDNSGGKGADGYTDGAERLDRKRSLSGAETRNTGIANLQELGALVSDSEHGMQRLSIDTGTNAGSVEGAGDDRPILPTAPGGNSLRRSTRTTYRRGSLRKGERVPLSKRGLKSSETDGEESPISSPMTPAGEPFGLSRVQTEPMPSSDRVAENFSRPGRTRRVVASKSTASEGPQETVSASSAVSKGMPSTTITPKHFVSQIASNGRKLESPFAYAKMVPHIIETPPPSDESRPMSKQGHIPARTSSHEPPPSLSSQGPLSLGSSPPRGPVWPAQGRQSQIEKGNQTLKDMAAHPSPLPGNSTRTDSLSFIPTLTEDRKADSKKPKEKKDSKDGADGPRKSSWSWGALLGTEEKEKEKKRDDETKKARSKLGKPPEKTHDNTRLDLLQTTMEGSRGRESLVLDRGDLRLEEERKKESSRKASGSDGKREKDPGLFSTLFGGKKKNEREAMGKKQMLRNLSPDPPPRLLKPDIDYNWTRFSILEERAIYRMAHIKLANPRRALHSQVLLSNFMYSYLAKVQQMHPQIQIPQSAAQKQQQKKGDQPEEFYQYQKYQEVSIMLDDGGWGFLADEEQQQQRQQQHEDDQTHVESQRQDSTEHGEGSQYEYGHGDHDQRNRPQSRASQHETHPMENGTGHHHRTLQQNAHNPPQSSAFQYQQSQFDDPGRSADEMW